MSYPKVEVCGRVVVLLTGFDCAAKPGARGAPNFKIHALDELEQSAQRHADAVAFGYVVGRWLPAA